MDFGSRAWPPTADLGRRHAFSPSRQYLWRLPRNDATSLQMQTKGGIEPIDNCRVLNSQVILFVRVSCHIVQFERFKWRVLQQFPVGFTNRFDRLASVTETAFASSKQPLSPQCWLNIAH